MSAPDSLDPDSPFRPLAGDCPLFVSLLRDAGLPEPVAEHVFAPPRRWRFDYAYPDHGIGIEWEGAVWRQGRHTRGGGYTADIEKYNAAAILGWLVVRFTYDMLTSGYAIVTVREALQATHLRFPLGQPIGGVGA